MRLAASVYTFETDSTSSNPRSSQRGFTVVELLVVMAVIAILVGMTLAAWPVWRNRSMTSATRGVVQAVAAAISDYGFEYLTLGSASNSKTWRLWNIDQANGDTLLDGHPEVDDPSIINTTHANYLVYINGYRGFADTVKPNVPPTWIDSGGHVLDAWKQPLRITWAAGVYGASGFGVWSIGRDGLDGSADDITSWER